MLFHSYSNYWKVQKFLFNYLGGKSTRTENNWRILSKAYCLDAIAYKASYQLTNCIQYPLTRGFFSCKDNIKHLHILITNISTSFKWIFDTVLLTINCKYVFKSNLYSLFHFNLPFWIFILSSTLFIVRYVEKRTDSVGI